MQDVRAEATLRNDVLDADHISRCADTKAQAFIDLSDRVWGMPELRFEEFRSVEEHIAAMEAEGFRITRGIAGMKTAFIAEAGEGEVTIGFLGSSTLWPGFPRKPALRSRRLPSRAPMAMGATTISWVRLLSLRPSRCGMPWRKAASRRGFAITDALPKKVDRARPIWRVRAHLMTSMQPSAGTLASTTPSCRLRRSPISRPISASAAVRRMPR